MGSSVLSSPILHLVASALFSSVAFAYTIAFVDGINIIQRTSVFLLSMAIAGNLQCSVPVFTGNSTYDGFFMSLLWLLHLRAFDLLIWKAAYLKKSVDGRPQKSSISANRTDHAEILTAWCLLFNFRNLNTEWTIKSVPPFSTSFPEYTPNKSELVKNRILQVLFTYLSLDALFAFLPASNPSVDVPEYKQRLFSRIEDVTLEEIIARPITVIIPAFTIYGMFTVLYNIASIIAVLFLEGEPRDWPPVFGSFSEAYTLRRFWGKSWHQLFRSGVESASSFLAIYMFGIPPPYRIISRYVRLHLAFLITALIHLPGVVIFGKSSFPIGVLKFFLMQAVGISIESMVFNIWTAMSRTMIDDVPTGYFTKILGYIWVLAWTSWTGPEFTWAIARGVVPGKDDTVPWSILKWLGYGK